ncbi:hypothetical protein QYF36_000093 [Acer negundo]|nr:hypothetical protein QYF36_000093 [Acer negundo]
MTKPANLLTSSFKFQSPISLSKAVVPSHCRRHSSALRPSRRYPATVDDIRRRVFESSRSEKHADVVNLTSSRSELASSFRTGNISSIWVQFQDIPVGKSIQFKFHDLPELGEKLEPEKGPINGEEQELENELKYSWWMLYHGDSMSGHPIPRKHNVGISFLIILLLSTSLWAHLCPQQLTTTLHGFHLLGSLLSGFARQLNNSDLLLLAIWFNKIPERTIVWYANGDNPAPRGLTIELTTNVLVVNNPRGQTVWNASLSPANDGFSSVTEAAMLDTGNFVLTGWGVI